MIVGGNKDGRVYVKTDFINDYTYINPNNIAAAHFETKATDITSNMTIKAYETKFGTSGLTATQAYNNCCNKLDGVISTNTLLKSQVLQNGQYDIDIKSIVKNWLKGALNESNASEDFGFVLMTTTEGGEYKFGSTENSVIGMYPSISIDYREESVVSEDWHFLKNVGSGKYLVRSSDTGSAIDHGSEFMKFEITKYSEGTTVDGIYEISFETELARKYLYKTNSGVVFRFINPLTMGNDAYYTEVNSRHWRIVKNADGTVRIMNVDAPNMALTCDTNANSGNNVRLSEYSGISSQKWRLYRANSKTGKYSVSAEEWPEDAATNQNLVFNDTPTLEYGTTLTSNVSGTGEVVVSGKTTMTDGIITNGNMDIYPNTLAQYDPDLKSFEAMKFLKPDGTYRDVGELYLDITFDLGSRYSLDKIYVASNTENNYYRTGAFEVYVSDNVSSLYDPRNRYVDFDNHLERLDSAIIKVDFVDIAKGRYVGIRVTQGVIENYDWQPSHVDYAYVRMRGVAIFGSNIGPDDSVHTTEVMSVSDWPSSASTEQNLLSASGVTQTMKYGTMGLSNVEGERGATTYGKTSITDGDISCNMDIYWDGITQFDPENNSYRNLRFLNKSGVYRQPGELFLDITYDLGSVKNLGELWIATNTENNYYKTGVYEVYISNSLDDLYYTDNFYTSFDSRNEKYSGITKTAFSCGKEGRYLGIRITQGIINKPTTDPWSTSNITAAYARMRGIALFEYNLDDGEIYRIVNTTSGFALEVKGAGTDSGTRLWQNNLDLEANPQEFTFDYISNGEYKIKPKNAEGMILGLNESSQVILVEDSNANSSRWYVKSCMGNEYTIVNKAHSGKFLSVGNQTETETYPSLSTSNVGSIWVIKNFESTVVSTIPISQVCIEPTELTLNVDEAYYLNAYVVPSNANQTIYYESSNPSVATVGYISGLVCASSPGTTTITARSADGEHLAYCSLTIRSTDPLHPSNIEYIRYTRIPSSQTSHLLCVVSSSIQSDHIFSVTNENNGVSKNYLITNSLKNQLNGLEAEYNSHLIPTTQSSVEEAAAHAAKGETDQLVEAGYISENSSEYYGAWASNYEVELDIYGYWEDVIDKATAEYGLFLAVSGYFYSSLANGANSTVYSSQYINVSRQIDDIATQLTNNPNSSKVMLGTTTDTVTWHQVASQQGMSYFYTPNWNSYVAEYGDDMMRAANKEFLFRQKAAGKQFWFSHDPMSTLANYPNSSFAMELNWLKESYGLSQLTSSNFIKSGSYWYFVP